MADVIPFLPVKRTIRRLAKREIEQMNELYRITGGYQDPTPSTDLTTRKLFNTGIIEDMPWE